MLVYKASAGSGKTFRLTIEYLKIVLARPVHYKKILAITFTNKATAEMKNRILAELHTLASGEKSNYLAILETELPYNSAEIQERAKQAEQYILHDYSRFSVLTIDAFFQTILKAFAKELGVSYNYNVELDEGRIRQLATERMFAELSENKALLKWLSAYVKDKINDGRSWNITQDVFQLSRELFQENLLFIDKEQFQKWNDKAFVQKLSKSIHSYMQTYENSLHELGKKATEIIKKNGLTVDDFSRKKSGVAGLFEKLDNKVGFVDILNSYHHKALNNSEGWYTKSTKAPLKQQIEALFPTLNEILQEIFTTIEQKQPYYQSCVLVNKNLYLMGIFSDVARHIYDILHEEEKILLSESNKLLYELIDNNEAPFIYEKTGNQYLYFLWDEFQDTSQVQWHNLKPLLANALAEGNPCLIVGDVKQAIYRWRNSDWQILGNQLKTELPMVDEVTMKDNWRSDARIVTFNNELFKTLPSQLENRLDFEEVAIQQIYEDVKQEVKGTAEQGYVHFSYLEASEEFTDEELVLQKLPHYVEELQQNGVKPEDIVFLVRENKQAIAIADFFANLPETERKQDVNYDVVSEFALLLENAFVVKVLVNAMYWCSTKESYYKAFLEKLMDYIPEGMEKLKKWEHFIANTPENNSLEVLFQQIVTIFGLHELKKEQLYLMAFEEFVNTSIEKQITNLADFLDVWETKKTQLSVTPGEQIPAMQVMTVHKAKGLEFHTVILPFANKNLDQIINGTTFWQKANFEPLEDAGALLLPFSKNTLLSSTFAEAYKEEMHQRYIDELNVFYVATTRAVHNLFIIASEKSSTQPRMTTLLYEMVNEANEDSFWGGWDEDLREWTYGKLVASSDEKKEVVKTHHQEELFYQNYLKKFPLHSSVVDEAKRESAEMLTPIEDGKIWHKLLESVRYVEDIPVAVKRGYYAGIVTAQAVQNYTMHLQELLTRKTIKDYYTAEYEVWNERPIWINGDTFIPDRVVRKGENLVVIEYKFGEAQTNAHQKQVKKYLNFFREQGYQNVKGFLIYGVFSEIIEVELNDKIEFFND